MKLRFILFVLVAMLTRAAQAQNGRGLWACKTVDEKNVFVNWRMLSTDDPHDTTYRIYANNRLRKTLKDRTNTVLNTGVANQTIRLEVLDAEGNIIDTQEAAPCGDRKFFHHIKLDYPGNYTMTDGTVVTY